MFSEIRWEVIVCFFDIEWNWWPSLFKLFFCVQWVTMRGDCLFCWYWWNWWPLLVKLSFCLQWVKMGGDCLFCWYWWNWWLSLLKLSCFCSVRYLWEVIVFFIDIGGIDDHYCLSFLVCVQWVKMRGDCLLFWYWWNWWPSLFKLFLCSVSYDERWLFVLLTLMELMTITVKLSFLCSVS